MITGLLTLLILGCAGAPCESVTRYEDADADGFGDASAPVETCGTEGVADDGVSVGDEAGWSVAGAGDTDGDGVPDLLVGAPSVDGGRGAAYLVSGSVSGRIDLDDGMTLLGAGGDAAGVSVSGAGDTDGDGLHDVLVGAYLNSDRATEGGAAYLFLGR